MRPEFFGYLALQVAHLVSEAALMLATPSIFFDSRIMTGAPSLNTSSGSAAHAGAYRGVVEELPAACSVLLAARRRCGAECDAPRRRTVDQGLCGRRGRPSRVNGGAD